MAEVASGTGGALSPLSESRLNCNVASSKKRKHIDDVEEDLRFKAFTATVLLEANKKSTHTLVPITKFDRSKLRLSCLDFSSDQTSLPSGYSFLAHIPILTGYPASQDPELLLARLAPNGRLYIIESAGSGVFLACRLRSWVQENHFVVAAGGVVDNDGLNTSCGYDSQSSVHGHLTPASVIVGANHSPKRPKNRKGVLARMLILPKSEPQERSPVCQEPSPDLKTDAPAADKQTGESAPGDLLNSLGVARNGSRLEAGETTQHRRDTRNMEKGPDSSTCDDDPFATHREILLKTLYTSQTALAYFTKSTLARTRATFRSSATTSTADLADFYRSRLVSSKKMDVKYRDTIPSIIENFVPQESPEKSEKIPTTTISRKRPLRRKKLGKDGLFAGEEDFIRTWWLNREGWRIDASSARCREQEIQALLADLRNRDTQLQIILMLEILTLESTPQIRTEEVAASTQVKQETDDDESNSILAKTPAKVSKKRDIRPDLDILVDRLCIYQSISIVDSSVAEDAQKKNGESGKDVNDKLRDFCCNVILPFYLHKAPHLVREISRKLGGPNLSPKRSTASSKTTSSSCTKSGAAVDTRQGSIPRRTLERVLSEDQSIRNPTPPVLMRSATAPLGGISAQVAADTTSRPSSRGSLQKSRSFINREVDLVASSKAHNAKQKKLANLAKQKQELSAAILALKKPNRSLAGMEIMAEAEKRGAERDKSGRSVLGRSSSMQNLAVQITATPKKGGRLDNTTGRGRRAFGETAQQPENFQAPMLDDAAVPSSTTRNPVSQPTQFTHNSCNGLTARRASIYPSIHETPSRGSHKTTNPLNLPPATTQQPNSPANLTLIQATPSSTRIHNPTQIDNTPLRMTKSKRPVLFLPLQKAEVRIESAFRDAPVVSEDVGRAMDRVMNADSGKRVRDRGFVGSGEGARVGKDGKEVSIYEDLGWDDDLADELL